MEDLNNIIDNIIQLLKVKSPLVAKKIMRNLKRVDSRHAQFAAYYFNKYDNYLNKQGKSLEYGVDCFVRLMNDMLFLRTEFLQSGKYINTSFDEVNRAVYSNPFVMEYHMQGLLLAQFLWPDQYVRFTFFHDNLLRYQPISNYLEVGGGHGIYINDAVTQLSALSSFDLVDISESSLKLSRAMLHDKAINYYHEDIFNFSPGYTYDFITIGEVIEHLETPQKMLQRLRELLSDHGTIYLTTPINAPMIDHIYLFNNEQEIRDLIVDSGFSIVQELLAISEDVSLQTAAELKLPLMYAAFLKKS
jgi:2-polyprenyl-3-methyl-5-hydroxy-6-metoxy-1,4-benzoquinol methylase